jgi:hypothetical protein
MKLTVPEEPQLLTAHRSKSASSKGTMQRSMSKHRLPREQAAIEQHLGRAAAARIVQDKLGKPGTKASVHTQTQAETEQWVREASVRTQTQAETEQWVREAPDAEERAQRARFAAQAEHEAALVAQKERLCIF